MESNLGKIDMISRFPFHGKSKYLIDKLYIIGYDNYTINKILKKRRLIRASKSVEIDTSSKNKKYPNSSNKIYSISKDLNLYDNINQITIPESPSLLNEIVNDYNKKVLDIDMIIQMIFPNKPIFYSVKDRNRHPKFLNDITLKLEFNQNISEEINEIIDKKKYYMVFSSNPQSDTNNKKSINGFCYINYLKVKEIKDKKINNDDYSFYFPIVLCFISEYPYYNSYYKLAGQIFNLFNSNNIEVPIEIMLHNIINYTLSPINGDIDLYIEPVSFSNNINQNSLSDNDVANYNNKSDFSSGSENDDIEEKKKSISKFTKNEKDNTTEIIEEEEFLKKLDNLTLANKSRKKNCFLKQPSVVVEKNISELLRTKTITKGYGRTKTVVKGNGKSNNLFEIIKFPFLQGYPLLHYNLPKILFDSCSITKLIFLFINSFCEQDILIFSKDIEILSLFINSLINLNFPLNDSSYYNINASVSFDNFIHGNCKFIPSGCKTIIGINTPFQLKCLNKKTGKTRDKIIFDLDNNKIDLKNEKNNNFFSYIKKIVNAKDDKEYKNSILSFEIRTLYDSLKAIKSKYLNFEINLNDDDDYYLSYDKQLNIEIQESFYRFILNISVCFYRQLTYQLNMNLSEKENDKNNNSIKIEFTNIMKNKYTYEEKYFFNKFINTLKFRNFFTKFINENEAVDLYRIPYLFFEEYLSIISSANDPNIMNNYVLKFFNVFDNLYQKNSQKINIDFNPFLSEYFKKYKSDFERDIIDFNYEGKNIIKYSYNKKKLKYQWYELDNELLLKYILFKKSLDKIEYERLFNLNSFLNENISKKIMVDDIEEEIEKEIFTYDYYNNGLLIKDDDICCMNIILLITISLNDIDDNTLEKKILIVVFPLLKNFFLFRKYYYILIAMIYKIIYNEFSKKRPNEKRLFTLLNLYYQILNSIIGKNIIPNSKILNVISNMNKIEKEIKKYTFYKDNEINNNKDDNYKIKYIIYANHNYTNEKIIKEKELKKLANRDDNNDKNNSKNDSGLTISFGYKDKTFSISPRIKLIAKIMKKDDKKSDLSLDLNINSQRLIKNILNEEYQKYIKNNMNIKSIELKKIMLSLLNIYFYAKNTHKFEEKIEILIAIDSLIEFYIKKLIN